MANTVTRNGRILRRRWVPWAPRLLNVYSVDVMVCPRCESRRQRIVGIRAAFGLNLNLKPNLHAIQVNSLVTNKNEAPEFPIHQTDPG